MGRVAAHAQRRGEERRGASGSIGTDAMLMLLLLLLLFLSLLAVAFFSFSFLFLSNLVVPLGPIPLAAIGSLKWPWTIASPPADGPAPHARSWRLCSLVTCSCGVSMRSECPFVCPSFQLSLCSPPNRFVLCFSLICPLAADSALLCTQPQSARPDHRHPSTAGPQQRTNNRQRRLTAVDHSTRFEPIRFDSIRLTGRFGPADSRAD
jgi:hypothetical protein